MAKDSNVGFAFPDGSLDEAVISEQEANALAGTPAVTAAQVTGSDAEKIRLLIKSARIRLAYAHDRHFAVSLSGIRTPPHQIEVVYFKMLPQPRLRFLLADDPGAGKTIMARLIKELKLREAIERALVPCPSPLQFNGNMKCSAGSANRSISSSLRLTSNNSPTLGSEVIK